jgi:hypothetical protein
MLRLFILLLTLCSLLFGGKQPADRTALIARLQRDLDKAMYRGTPTDNEILELKKARKHLNSPKNEEVSDAIETIDRVAHTQSFKSQDASDIRKDIGNIRGHKSFLFLRLP